MRKAVTFMVFILVIILGACSSSTKTNESGTSGEEVNVNKEGYPIVDEELTMTLMAPGHGKAEWEDMPVMKEYKEKTNMDFEYNTPPADDFDTNLNLAFASEDLDDIIYGAGTNNLTPGMEIDYGSQDILLPLEDLIEEYAPNLQNLLEDRPDILKSITTIDGHIYSLPYVSYGHKARWGASPIWFNGEWLDALNVEELPKTIDDFYDLLVRFRDEDPNGNGEADEIPLSGDGLNDIRTWLMGAFGLKDQDIEEVDGNVRYAPITENYKEYLVYMNTLYEDKLLDPEVFSHSSDQYNAKGQENQLGAFTTHHSYMVTGETEEESLNNPMFHPLTSPLTDEIMVPSGFDFSRGAFSLTKNNPNPAASIRWVDYFYTEEGGAYLDQGPEGYLWEWNEDKTKREPLPLPEEFDSSEDYRATLTPAWGAITTPMLNPPFEVKKELSPIDHLTEEETEEKLNPYSETPYPQVYLTREEQKEVNTIQADLESYVEQMEAKFITGVEPISKWEDYVSTIEEMNIDRYVEIHQDAYDRWDEGE